jgi:hypothetical protein
MVIAFLRFILFVFVAYVAFLFLRVFLGLKQARTRTQRPAGAPRPAQGVMVKDEVCGTYIPRDEALTEARGEVERYYCSEECRRKGAAR